MMDVLFFSVIPLTITAVLLNRATSPVARSRVNRFAERHQLTITPDNGDAVITYLATTRRWRILGIIAALGVGNAWLIFKAFVGEDAQIPFMLLFIGWFLGAILAEARFARRPSSERRRASLQPRRLTQYLPTYARLAVPIAVGVSLAFGGSTAVALSGGWCVGHGQRPAPELWCGHPHQRVP
jgi:hypothetical protein